MYAGKYHPICILTSARVGGQLTWRGTPGLLGGLADTAVGRGVLRIAVSTVVVRGPVRVLVVVAAIPGIQVKRCLNEKL